MSIPDYIIKTTHPDNHSFTTKTDEWKADIMQFCDITVFSELKVIEFEPGEDKAYVTFTAVLSQARKDATFTERSTFAKENGRWLYVSGEIKSGNLF
jgi:SEC-C motif-containing protein